MYVHMVTPSYPGRGQVLGNLPRSCQFEHLAGLSIHEVGATDGVQEPAWELLVQCGHSHTVDGLSQLYLVVAVNILVPTCCR